jgi:hypothetical protein
LTNVLQNPSITTADYILKYELDKLQKDFASKDNATNKIFLWYYLENLHHGPKSHAIMQVVYKLTANYYLFGSAAMFTAREVLELVESALCPLQHSAENSLEAAIVEPTVAWTCYHFFKHIKQPIEDYMTEVIPNLKISPTSYGLFWEFVVIPKIMEYFKCDDLSKHPYFADKKVPKWLQAATLDFDKNKTLIGNASTTATLASYLKGNNFYVVL